MNVGGIGRLCIEAARLYINRTAYLLERKLCYRQSLDLGVGVQHRRGAMGAETGYWLVTLAKQRSMERSILPTAS